LWLTLWQNRIVRFAKLDCPVLAVLILLQVLLIFTIAYSPPSSRHQGTFRFVDSLDWFMCSPAVADLGWNRKGENRFGERSIWEWIKHCYIGCMLRLVLHGSWNYAMIRSIHVQAKSLLVVEIGLRVPGDSVVANVAYKFDYLLLQKHFMTMFHLNNLV
jgi:hypothetical protein